MHTTCKTGKQLLHPLSITLCSSRPETWKSFKRSFWTSWVDTTWSTQKVQLKRFQGRKELWALPRGMVQNCQLRKEGDIAKTSCTAEPQASPTRMWDPTWVAVTIGRWAVRYGVKDWTSKGKLEWNAELIFKFDNRYKNISSLNCSPQKVWAGCSWKRIPPLSFTNTSCFIISLIKYL